MKWLTLTLLSVTIACSASTSNPPRATASGISSPRADFSKYQTYSFGPANQPASGFSTTERSLEVQRKLASLVGASLQERGYHPSTEKADLLIKISAGSGTLDDDKVERGSPSAPIPAGVIGVDAYDSVTGITLWHGSAFAEIDPQRIDEQLLSRGVKQMLASFPNRAE